MKSCLIALLLLVSSGFPVFAINNEVNPYLFNSTHHFAQAQHLSIPNIRGLTYHDARKKLIASGWQPRKLRNLREPVDATYGNAPLFLNYGYDELITCSGTGVGACLFEFFDVYGNYLTVTTGGEEITEERIYAIVNNWKIYRKPYFQRERQS